MVGTAAARAAGTSEGVERRRGSVVVVTEIQPTCLLYLLAVGKEHEIVLALCEPAPSDDDVVLWMRDRVVRELRVSRHGGDEVFTFVVNFAHVVAARVAPYGEARSYSF